jgi:hypothetical protein
MALRNGAILATVFIGSLSGGNVAADVNDNPRVAFFGFALINTSLEPTSPVEETRLRMLDDLLREKLDASGRFRIVIIPPPCRRKSPLARRFGTATGVSATSRRGLVRTGRRGELSRRSVTSFSISTCSWRMHRPESSNSARAWIFVETPTSLGVTVSTLCSATTFSVSAVQSDGAHAANHGPIMHRVYAAKKPRKIRAVFWCTIQDIRNVQKIPAT